MKRGICLLAAAWILVLCLPGRVWAESTENLGKSHVLMEMETGKVLSEHNSHEPLAPASVTKIMTMLLIMEALDCGRIRWEDTVTASETAAAKGGSQVYLKAGEAMSVTDMLKSIAVSSANDCACAMAEHLAGSEAAFVDQMNARAAELGMENTHFVNCTGLDDGPDAASHRTTAYDIALMSRELMKNHRDITKFTTIWMDSIRNGSFGLSNTNKLIRFYPGATGLKTGYTSGAGYCLSATAEREGMTLIAVVMGAETSPKRNAGCKALLDYGFANFALVTPDPGVIPLVPVVLGTSRQVTLIPGDSCTMLLDKGQKNTVTAELLLDPSVTAPVSLGQRLGTMQIRAGEQLLAEIPMVTDRDVPRISWKALFCRVLRQVAMAKET